MITLTDIKNVQLKKVTNTERSKVRNQSDSGPLVSMSDLKGIRLRRVKSACDENSMDTQSKLSMEAVSLRRTLKKVTLLRSPGGTPMRSKKQMDTGTGLTPLMTRALRTKFKSIRTPSPVGQPFDKISSPKKQATTPSKDPIQIGNLFDTSS
ncbi:proline-rich protein 11-like [Amphiura filiformis]|uniref:proline-rich protein 11-like n=1 Tax=Amphiura filiformis TaxID=82378 RepID=UPI003B20F2F3